MCCMCIFSDIFMDNNCDKRVETLRSGVFKFQLGLSEAEIRLPLQRVVDAQARFRSSPLSSVATDLEKEVVVSSIFGTNSIEGGELNEQETEQVLGLSPEQIQTIHQRRVVNIKNAYDFIRDVASQVHWQPTLSDVCHIHVLVSEGLQIEAPENIPGRLRDNPEGIITRVGNDEHGGIYKPPQLGKDIQLLLSSLLDWNRELTDAGIPALIRAPCPWFIALYDKLTDKTKSRDLAKLKELHLIVEHDGRLMVRF